MRQEFLQTDFTSWRIGPYHGALPGPMKMDLKLDGEVIVTGSVETGFVHRGLEKTMELHAWQALVAYADRLDPEGAIYGELALCLAVEGIGAIPVPPRAQAIRLIVAELTRISSHLHFVAKIARSVGSPTILHYVLRDRERILDLMELLTGARFSLNFLRYGGVSSDVTEGFIERVLESCDLIRIRLKEYNDLFSFNQAFLKRTTGIGIIAKPDAQREGLTGPNARASGMTIDARKAHPYSGYEKIDFDLQGDLAGDVHGRFLIRLREITQSIEILRQVVENIPEGPFENGKVGKEFKIPAGESYARVESARGLLGCHVVSDGGLKPARVQFRVPSVSHVGIIPTLIVGERLEDLPIILASLDIGISEVDR